MKQIHLLEKLKYIMQSGKKVEILWQKTFQKSLY
jgi:hypothetical protein